MTAKKTIIQILVYISVIFSLVGCANLTPIVQCSDNPEADLAYVYGRFQLTKPKKKLKTQSGTNAIVLVNDKNDKEYRLRFKWKDEVYAVALEPGRYRVTKWVIYDCLGAEKVGEMQLEGHIRYNGFELKPGCAYYLGDFVCTFEHKAKVLGHKYTHILKKPKNDFTKTTYEFNQRYPAFIRVPKVPLFRGNFFKDEFNKDHHFIHDITNIPVVVPISG